MVINVIIHKLRGVYITLKQIYEKKRDRYFFRTELKRKEEIDFGKARYPRR